MKILSNFKQFAITKLSKLKNFNKSCIKFFLRPTLILCIKLVLRSPFLKRHIGNTLMLFPRIRSKLLIMAKARGLINQGSTFEKKFDVEMEIPSSTRNDAYKLPIVTNYFSSKTIASVREKLLR